ncbi:MAG: IS1634 family transposase [Candidatus Brocadiales bacterium]|nr:IS1634 family transposase [Candidatus Brocadiales bacterium]
MIALLKMGMFIRKKKTPKTPSRVSIQIVESCRKGDKVSQTIVRHVGIGETVDEIEQLMALAKTIKARLEEERQPTLPLFTPEKLIEQKTETIDDDGPLDVNLKNLREEQRFNEGIIDVFGNLYDQLNFNKIFTGRHAKLNNSILKSCVMARLANPSSKLRTSELLEDDFAIRLPVDKIYRMMKQLDVNSSRVHELVRNSTVDLLDQKVNILFYDVTTLYFESFTPDEIRNFGFSKDCKFKETQLVMAMITTTNGLPITYKIFPGNTQETKTLLPVIEELREQYNVDDIDFAADRGMFSDDNLSKLEKENIKYVIAAKLKNMSKKTKEEILKINDNNDDNDYKLMELEHKGRRLIVNYSPARANKDRKDRERLIDRVKKIANKDGKVEVKKLVNNNGTKKYLKFEKEKKSIAQINEEKIKLEEQWDGIAGYVTNSTSSAHEVISRYKGLWEIEESFRINKHDLKIRPIFHREENKIKAHLDICFLSYALARQLSYRYEVQQGERISFNVARNELLKVQASVLYDRSTKKRYIMPSKISSLAKKLYSILGLKKSQAPYRLNKM